MTESRKLVLLAILDGWVTRERLVSWVKPRSGTTALLRYDLPVPSANCREALSPEDLFAERLAMGLRLRSGVDWEAVCAAYGQDPEPRRVEIGHLVHHGLATLQGGRLVVTEAGADLHSAIAAKLIQTVGPAIDSRLVGSFPRHAFERVENESLRVTALLLIVFIAAEDRCLHIDRRHASAQELHPGG